MSSRTYQDEVFWARSADCSAAVERSGGKWQLRSPSARVVLRLCRSGGGAKVAGAATNEAEPSDKRCVSVRRVSHFKDSLRELEGNSSGMNKPPLQTEKCGLSQHVSHMTSPSSAASLLNVWSRRLSDVNVRAAAFCCCLTLTVNVLTVETPK